MNAHVAVGAARALAAHSVTGYRRRAIALALACIALTGVILMTIRVITARRPDVRTIKVDPHPVAFAIDQDNGRAYVVSASSDSVSVLDTRAETLIHFDDARH